MNEPVETIKLKNGNILKIYQDEDPESPRDWDNLGSMICFHNRYDLGDKHNLKPDSFGSWEEIEQHLIKEFKAVVILPLYLYDHSGITISTKPFGCRWDSGQVGYIIATRKDITTNFDLIPNKRITKQIKQKTEQILIAETKTYDQYLTGDTYGYKLFDKNNIEIDSCWGYYGDYKEIINEVQPK